MFKLTKLGFKSMWTKKSQMSKLDLEKAEGAQIKLPTSQKKQESSRETSTSAFLTTPNTLKVWISTNWKILKEMEIIYCCCCKVASVMSNSVRPHRWQPTRLRRPWDSPGKNTGVGCHFLLQRMKWKVKVKSFSRVRDPMDYSPPDFSVHGIFQARVLQWGTTESDTT